MDNLLSEETDPAHGNRNCAGRWRLSPTVGPCAPKRYSQGILRVLRFSGINPHADRNPLATEKVQFHFHAIRIVHKNLAHIEIRNGHFGKFDSPLL